MKPKVEETPPVKKEKTGGESDQEMMNLEKEIYSLTHYADDEEELVAHMFATIKGSKLEAMMPPILKEIPLIDVQQLCLHELRGMSQRRILSIINGQEMSGSSSDENSDEDKKHHKLQDDNEDSNLGTRSMDEGDEKELNEMEGAADSNLTALDILELEMRAKLIKTMLEKQDGEEDGDGDANVEFDPNLKIKEEPLTPDSTNRGDPERDDDSSHSRGSASRKSRRRRYSRSSRSDSRSYSSSYSSRSSSSSSRSYSSERKKEPTTKKRITKKEFEARMRKAKMNRSYRKRKDSEEDSGGEASRRKGRSRRKKAARATSSSPPKDPKALPEADAPEEEAPAVKEDPEEAAEEELQAEEGEVTEKEEGEIDSNEERAYSSSRSRSRSRSYSSGTYSSYSSRSSSRSSRRRRRKRRSKARKHRRSRSRSDDVPKVPNWKGSAMDGAPSDEARLDVDPISPEETSETPKETLPGVEERQSISFSFSKKSAPIKGNPELNDDGIPVRVDPKSVPTQEEDPVTEAAPEEEGEEEEEVKPQEVVAEVTATLKKVTVKERGPSRTATPDVKPKGPGVTSEMNPRGGEEPKGEAGEVVEDFYKGADQLSFSEEEGECEDEADLERFLHDDTPVEPIHIGENLLRKSVKVVSNKDEPPIVSWESKKKKDRMKGDLVIEGVGFLKTVLSEGQNPSDSPMEDSNEPQQQQEEEEEEEEGPEQWTEDISQAESLPDTLEELSQDAAEPLLQDLEADDSQEPHSLDIIGVIDPKDTENPHEAFDEDLSGGGSSWSMRWLQSEKVQKVVSNSKMLSKVRKKIQAKGKGIPKKQAPQKPVVPAKPKAEVKPEVPTKPEPSKPVSGKSSSVIGSIEEYEKLFGIKVKAPTSLPQPKPAAKPSSQAASMFSDDDDDSEEDAIWSKIIKK